MQWFRLIQILSERKVLLNGLESKECQNNRELTLGNLILLDWMSLSCVITLNHYQV